MLTAALGLQPDSNVGDVVVEACEPAEEVDGERAGGMLHVHRELVRAGGGLGSDALYLLQQVSHCQDLVLLAAHGSRANAGDLLQMLSGLRREKLTVK